MIKRKEMKELKSTLNTVALLSIPQAYVIFPPWFYLFYWNTYYVEKHFCFRNGIKQNQGSLYVNCLIHYGVYTI